MPAVGAGAGGYENVRGRARRAAPRQRNKGCVLRREGVGNKRGVVRRERSKRGMVRSKRNKRGVMRSEWVSESEIERESYEEGGPVY